MNGVENQLKELILARYGSMANFCKKTGIPWSTMDSIMKRGIENANIKNVLKITDELGIEVEALANGKIVYKPETIAAHFDGSELSDNEVQEIMRFIDFVKSKRD